jgi:hypothetical protein
MAKQMYNAREPATGGKVEEIQDLYRKVYPRICAYEMKYDQAQKKNEKPKTLKEKVLNASIIIFMIAMVIAISSTMIWATSNVTDSFTLSMTILASLVGGPIVMIVVFGFYVASLPTTKEVFIKFPLKEEEKKFRKLITELGEELETGGQLRIFINNRPEDMKEISFKKPIPKHILFRGDNSDVSKRSFLFETVDDEITVLLPDFSGVYQYDKKPKGDTSGIPDANMPRYAAEGVAITGDTFF